MNNSFFELLAFLCYFALMIGIGVFFFFKTRNGNVKDYFLGGRKMNGWVTALSAQASDMSAWLLMGLPGSILAAGVGKVWIAIGLLIGTYLNWKFTAPRLRSFSKAANDSITVPEYLSNRFFTEKKTLRFVSAIVFLVCYAVYAASSFKACGTLFNTVFGIDVTVATLVAAGIILVYTFLGGFEAACWTDFVQGLLILVALMAAPIFALNAINNGEVTETAVVAENYWNLLPSGKLDWESISEILSGLAWGLGYFGMPHILVRFMSIKSAKLIKQSRMIAMVWIVLALGAAVAMALIGRVFLPTLPDAESSLVFIKMVRALFPAFISGLLLSGILAASMSTADSQLLVAASAFTSDIYLPVIRKQASQKETMWVSRLTVMVITIVAIFIALNPESGDIMSLVENAWAGFGSSFGPAILLSLFWKKLTYKGAVAGIITGAVVDLLWLAFLTGSTGIYELLPGFIAGTVAAYIGTKLDHSDNTKAEAFFDAAVAAGDND